MKFRTSGKHILDFNVNGKLVFTEEDLGRTLIVDDQYAAIAEDDRNSLLLSKKFVKYCDTFTSKQKMDEY